MSEAGHVRLIARELELATLVDAVTSGAGAVVSGEAGVGKSAIVRAVAAQVAARGDAVHLLVATASARDTPFGALAPLLTDEDASIKPALVLGALARRLRAEGRRPPLLVVDDAHLLDPQSASTLLGLVTSGAGRVLATVRSGERAPDAVLTLWKDQYVSTTSVEPLDRDATQLLLAHMLGGDVALSAVELMWQRTNGNPLYLLEIARDARARGQLENGSGVWIWHGEPGVPPRLADLLDRRFDGIDEPGLDALAVLTLAEPASADLLDEVAPGGSVELERAGLVEAERRQGSVWYRFTHPLIGAAAERIVQPSRRRRIAGRLVEASRYSSDVVQRSMWHLDASGPPDVPLLLAGADATLLARPALAQRLAERALGDDTTPRAALLLAQACAEQGDVDAAQAAQSVAVGRAHTVEDRIAVTLNGLSLTAFSDRRPDLALEQLDVARAGFADEWRATFDSSAALLAAFSARPADALARADAVLAAEPDHASALRALSARVLGLTMCDQPATALHEVERLLPMAAAATVGPYAGAMAHLATEVARHLSYGVDEGPVTDPASGRWPVPLTEVELEQRVGMVTYPLFRGVLQLRQGFADAAVPALREALAQQRSGEGLLRSETAHLLVVALAAAGNALEAQQVLDECGPDRLAIYPGLHRAAEAAIAAAAGKGAAADLALAAANEALAVGGTLSALGYLADASRYGAARQAAAVLDTVGSDSTLRSPRHVPSASEPARRAMGAGCWRRPSITPRSVWSGRRWSSPTSPPLRSLALDPNFAAVPSSSLGRWAASCGKAKPLRGRWCR